MSARIRMNGVADDSLIPTPPTGKATLFYNNDLRVYRAKLDDGSVITLSSDPEFIQDTVGTLFQDSATIDFTYDDAGNVAFIDVIQSALDISLIPNTPSGNLTSTILQDALNELQGNIDNILVNFDQSAQDAIGSAILAGNQDGISVVYDDPASAIDFTNTDKGSVAVTTHESALDPHPQYETSAEAQSKVDAHANLTNNPHSVTATQVGLGNVDNTSDLDKPISTATQNALDLKGSASEVESLIDARNAEKEPTGFPNRIDSTIFFDVGTRTFTIEPTSTEYEVFVKGKKITITSPKSIVIPNITQTNYFYLDENGDILTSNIFDLNLLSDFAYIAYLTWCSDTGNLVTFGEERHGIVMDAATHAYLHETKGTQLYRGGSIDVLVDNGGNDNLSAQVGYTNMTIADEDIVVDIIHSATPSNPFEQVLVKPAQIPLFYRDGATGTWKKITATSYPILLGVDRARFNEFSGGTWSLQDISEGNFGATFLFATTDIINPVIGIIGQTQVTNLADAELQLTWDNIDFGTLPFNEFKLLHRIIYNTSSSYTNDVRAEINKVTDYRFGIDRGISQTPSVTNHSNLTGLEEDDHLQYLPRSGSRSMTGDLDVGTNSIVNVNLVDGVDVSLHAFRHLPDGADPLTTGTPNAVGTSNQTGTANAFARQDHVHDHGAQTDPAQHAPATSSDNGFMSSSDKNKLDGVEAGATQNQTDSFLLDRANHTGTQAVSTITGLAAIATSGDKADIGLGNVDNTSDLDKPISVAQQTAIDLKYDSNNPNGYETPAELDARDTANRDRANHTGTQLASTISDFNTAASAAAPVQSVAGKTGTVSLDKADVGLDNVDNTSDLDKPISTATQAALDLKENIFNPNNESIFFDDFITGPNESLGWSYVNANGGGTLTGTYGIGPTNRPMGIQTIRTGGGNPSGRSCIFKNTNSIALGYAEVEQIWRFALEQLSTPVQRFIVYVGLHDNRASGAPVDGCYFVYSDSIGPNWRCITRSNNVQTEINSGIVANLDYNDFRILVNENGTQADFFINNVLVGTSTTNIPNTPTRATGIACKIEKLVGIDSRSLHIDYYYHRITFTGGRKT